VEKEVNTSILNINLIEVIVSGFEDSAGEWIKEGAVGIGGCCRITAKDIKKLKEKLEKQFGS